MLRKWQLVAGFVASRRGSAGRSGNKAATEWQHVASFVATPAATRRFLRGIASRVGEPSLDEPRTSIRTFPRPGSIQESKRPARNGTRPGTANRRSSPPSARPAARSARRSGRTWRRLSAITAVLSRRLGGWCLAIDFIGGLATCEQATPDKLRTAAGQGPGQMPDKLRTKQRYMSCSSKPKLVTMPRR